MSKRQGRAGPRQNTETQSVTSMLKDAVSKNKKSQRKPSVHSRSFAPKTMADFEEEMLKTGLTPEELMEDEDFFDVASATSPKGFPRWVPPLSNGLQLEKQQKIRAATEPSQQASTGKKKKKKDAGFAVKRRKAPKQTSGRAPDEDSDDGAMDEFMDFFNNSDRKQAGISFIGKIFGSEPMKGLDEKPKRPFVTWWVTIIQLVVYILSMVIYGIAPIGFGKAKVSGEVLKTSLVTELDVFFDAKNMWIGPREEDLIHLGAKFSPCMRKDENVQKQLDADAGVERQTACCVRNDGAGCFQSQESECPASLNTWNNWTSTNLGYQDRLSGSVCGQDPKFCKDPSSTGADIWPDDMTKWPVCKDSSVTSDSSNYPHMTCEVVGRPCCIGITGECIITTREHCDFRRGYFHENETLCSQVPCIEEVCGMSPFWNQDKPDQFYRLFSSQFLHAGLFTMLITILIQMVIMRELERMIGWWRMVILYFGSGVAGSLGSAIFLPYVVEAGPSGSQFGIIAGLYIEIIRRNKNESRTKVIIRMTIFLLFLFLVGLLPMVDNYAHLFGFGFGYLLNVAFLPYKRMCRKELSKCARIVVGVVHGLLAVGIFVILVILFYVMPIYDCKICSYFTCVPFTATFCDGQSIEITREFQETGTTA